MSTPPVYAKYLHCVWNQDASAPSKLEVFYPIWGRDIGRNIKEITQKDTEMSAK